MLVKVFERILDLFERRASTRCSAIPDPKLRSHVRDAESVAAGGGAHHEACAAHGRSGMAHDRKPGLCMKHARAGQSPPGAGDDVRQG